MRDGSEEAVEPPAPAAFCLGCSPTARRLCRLGSSWYRCATALCATSATTPNPLNASATTAQRQWHSDTSKATTAYQQRCIDNGAATAAQRHIGAVTHRHSDTSAQRHIGAVTHWLSDTSAQRHIGAATRRRSDTSAQRHIVAAEPAQRQRPERRRRLQKVTMAQQQWHGENGAAATGAATTGAATPGAATTGAAKTGAATTAQR